MALDAASSTAAKRIFASSKSWPPRSNFEMPKDGTRQRSPQNYSSNRQLPSIQRPNGNAFLLPKWYRECIFAL
jgi:hypothetical protein